MYALISLRFVAFYPHLTVLTGKSLYEILEVGQEASQPEIKKQYRKVSSLASATMD